IWFVCWDRWRLSKAQLCRRKAPGTRSVGAARSFAYQRQQSDTCPKSRPVTKYKAPPIWTAQPYVKIPVDVHARLAKIAGVPPEEHAAFASYVEMLIVFARGAAARQNAFSASDVRPAIKQIAKAATTMAAALEQAPVGAKEMLHLTSPTQH